MNTNITQKARGKNFLTGMKKIQFLKIKSLNIILPISTYFIMFGTAFAATGDCGLSNVKNFRELVMGKLIGCYLSPVGYLIVGFSVVLFLWGVFKFIMAQGDSKQEGRDFMFWGIVGLFVMVSLWGLVAIFQATFKLS